MIIDKQVSLSLYSTILTRSLYFNNSHTYSSTTNCCHTLLWNYHPPSLRRCLPFSPL